MYDSIPFLSALLHLNTSSSFSTPFSRPSRRETLPKSRSLSRRQCQSHPPPLRKMVANPEQLHQDQHRTEMEAEEQSARPRTSCPVLLGPTVKHLVNCLLPGLPPRLEHRRLYRSQPLLRTSSLCHPNLSPRTARQPSPRPHLRSQLLHHQSHRQRAPMLRLWRGPKPCKTKHRRRWACYDIKLSPRRD